MIPSTPNKKVDVVVGLDARCVFPRSHVPGTRRSLAPPLATLLPVDSGFLLGPILALRLGAAFVPVRKAGKLVRRAESCGAGWTRGY